jgi:hypothetical protein
MSSPPRKIDTRLRQIQGYLERGIQTPMSQGRSTQIISMIKWIRTRRLSIKNFLSSPHHFTPPSPPNFTGESPGGGSKITCEMGGGGGRLMSRRNEVGPTRRFELGVGCQLSIEVGFGLRGPRNVLRASIESQVL